VVLPQLELLLGLGHLKNEDSVSLASKSLLRGIEELDGFFEVYSNRVSPLEGYLGTVSKRSL